MTPLYRELNRWLITPWEWGRMDCMLSISDWVWQQTGVDPARDFRLTYHDQSSAQRVTRFLTEPLGITTQCFEGVAGLRPTSAPVAGDVAVIRVGPHHHVGAVFTGRCWTSKDDPGIHEYQAHDQIAVAKAWSVGYSP